ncbi:Protein ARRD-7 [Aphelenchoides avenae]|nr:Protein ARRD-7 [Aphelenchus avenae]
MKFVGHFAGDAGSTALVSVSSCGASHRTYITGRTVVPYRTVWRSSEDSDDPDSTIDYASELYYLDVVIDVWRAGEDGRIPAGHREFPFSFTLPTNIPPSFEGNYGFIRYYCKATIDRPWYKFNDHAITVFGVMPRFDLNTLPDAARPMLREITKNVGVLMFKHGRVSASVTVPKTGFVPGEAMPVSFAISNTSSKEVKCLEVKLVEHVTYIAFCNGRRLKSPHESCKHGKSRVHTRTLMALKDDVCVAAHSSAQVDRVLRVPATVPSFNICPTLIVSYYVKVKLVTKGHMGNEVIGEIPILVGTVPVRQPLDANAPKFEVELGPPAPSAPPADLPPPTYAESVFGKGTVLGDSDEKPPQYTPKYVYYNM